MVVRTSFGEWTIKGGFRALALDERNHYKAKRR